MEKINIIDTLNAIEASIVSHQFRDKENSQIELKSLSNAGEWKYERKLTADVEIAVPRINQQKEYKAELEYAKEITIVQNATLKDLSLDKINGYIGLINSGKRNETLKANLKQAKSFLERKHFIKDETITTLGMLVCGDDPFHFLEYRCEVDCYYDRGNDVSNDKQYFKDDVLTLMDEAFRFVWGHIKIGRTYEGGGKSVPEYSEELVREIVNNALAHRDYTINKFITVNIEPSQYIEIKNPGSFKERIKITDTHAKIPVRRLIPGIPESKNPKLADVLKVFEKIESQGRGMSALVNAALDNKIDMPYYDLKDSQHVSLIVPSGKLVDESIKYWLKSFNNYIYRHLRTTLTDEHIQVLAYFRKSEMLNRQRKYTILLSESNNHFNVIVQLREAGLITEHETASTDENPVYILNRELMKEDFIDELIGIYGEQLLAWPETTKTVLNIVYRYTVYNETAIRPVELTPEVYLKENGKDIDPKKYESLGRKVRKIMNDLRDSKILVNHEKGFLLNKDYHPENTMF